MRGSSRRAGLWSDPQAQVPLNGQCKAAGCNTSEPKVASSYGPAPADGIVAPGRLTGSGDEWTWEPFLRCRGVRGGTLCMFHVAGRELLPGPRRPLGTAASKAEPKSLPARQEVRGAHSTVWIARETGREGRSPATVNGAQRSLGCPMAARLPTEQTTSGNCREPSTAHPSRTSRRGFTVCMTRSGARTSSGRLCRKVRFLGQNPKIGYRKFNVLQTAKIPKKQLCDRAPSAAGASGCPAGGQSILTARSTPAPPAHT